LIYLQINAITSSKNMSQVQKPDPPVNSKNETAANPADMIKDEDYNRIKNQT
jgi:hypothetical protein